MSVSIRRITPTVCIKDVKIGSQYPIRIQSMTNTDTAEIDQTVNQIIQLNNAGSELVRVTVNTQEAMKAIPYIVEKLQKKDCYVPIVGDFHYNGHILLTKFPHEAMYLDKYRINPGNVGKGKTHDHNFKCMIEAALKHDKAVRIGVNAGSLDPAVLQHLMDENASKNNPKSAKEVLIDAMIKSALDSAKLAQDYGLSKEKLILSVKMSDVQDMISVYQRLASRCDYVLHVGLTEAGSGAKGLVSSSAALAILLQQGIGDTIRISLTPEPNKSRAEEVQACKLLLQSMGFRYFMPSVTSCPGCGRTKSNAFIHLANDVTTYIEQKMPFWSKHYPGVEKLKVAVMGCIVNGPGESKHADIGLSLPGTAEDPKIPVYQDGKRIALLDQGPQLKERFLDLLNSYIKNRFEIKKIS